MSSVYLEAYNEAVDWHLKRDLQAWAELLSRHHASLRRPYATGRRLSYADPLGDEHAGGADHDQHQPAPDGK